MWKKSRLNCEMIRKIWKKSKMRCEIIWKTWKKGKSNSDDVDNMEERHAYCPYLTTI
jgi:hypothetical protein